MSKRLTTDEFIRNAQQVHGKRYSYDKVVYTCNKTKVVIGCCEHGDFLQTPAHHNQGKGCRKCAIETSARARLGNVEEFIEKSLKVHKGRYSYVKSVYVSATDIIEVVCKEHGSFWQTPNSHLGGKGCPTCGNELIKRPRLTQEEFVAAARSRHGDKYDYSLAAYTLRDNKVDIICPIHGKFSQAATAHMVGRGCQQCMKTGYQVSKPGKFYVLEAEDGTVKVGITNRDVRIRCNDIRASSGKQFNVVYFISFQDGSLPKLIEAEVLTLLDKSFKNTDDFHDGYTECFDGVNTDKLLTDISSIVCKIFN